MFRRLIPPLAFVWMIVLGGVLLVRIGDPNLIGDPHITPVCIVCGGRTGSSDVGDIAIGILTLALGVAGLIVTLSQRSGISNPGSSVSSHSGNDERR
jgi:hypothetical protein